MVLLATFTGFPPDWKTAGIERPAPFPSLRPQALPAGGFGDAFERFFAQKFGLRGFGIRLAHQLGWEVFGVLPAPGGTPIDVGTDHWLYEHDYVRHNVRRYGMRRKEAVEFARRMSALRDRLAARGIPLVVCLSPSKAAVYPEHLLDTMRPAPQSAGKTPARDTLVAHLREELVVRRKCGNLLVAAPGVALADARADVGERGLVGVHERHDLHVLALRGEDVPHPQAATDERHADLPSGGDPARTRRAADVEERCRRACGGQLYE